MEYFIWPYFIFAFLLPFAVIKFFPGRMAFEKKQMAWALRVPFYTAVLNLAKSDDAPAPGCVKWLWPAWFFLTLAMMRPVLPMDAANIFFDSKNIMIALDASGSMAEYDFSIQGRPVSRYDTVISVVRGFIEKRKSDAIGLVVFGDQAYTYVPLTRDHKTLQILLLETGVGMAGEKTALGDALALSVQNILNVPSESKVIILLSDGYANAGQITTDQALDIARKNNVKIYTVGIGADPTPGNFMFAAPSADEQTLQKIARETRGGYFKANSARDLANIYQEIDRLESHTASDEAIPQKELFYLPLLGALFFFFIAWGQRGIK
jgi:Ca-activated chloride channel family protein